MLKGVVCALLLFSLQRSKEQVSFAPPPLSMPGVQGITLGYGGNPYGPAGTGKTESVKALGQALARQVALSLLVCAFCRNGSFALPVATYVMACDELMCMQCMQLAHATPHPVKQLKPHLLMP